MEENKLFFRLLRVSLGLENDFGCQPSAEEWQQLYKTAQKQSLVGVLFNAVSRVPADSRPPVDILLQWMSHAEYIQGLNRLFNSHSAHLTKVLEDEGCHTAILKGQANARLYPDPLSRQPGDIDIYVSGGRRNVTQVLLRTGLIDSVPVSTSSDPDKAVASYHHIHLPVNENGIAVEVHFRPASGNYNVFTNRRLQRFLESEIKDSPLAPEGFRVPDFKFALAMQLAHIQRHFLSEGIGLRQISDYLILLLNSSETDRAEIREKLRSYGLDKTAGALMWLLQQVYNLDEEHTLCAPDAFRGEWMLRDVMSGGNFGHHSGNNRLGIWKRFFRSKSRKAGLTRFDFREVFWMEINYWITIIRTLPERIRRRSLSLSSAPKKH
ncbi:MAG: nucleotidyltransferase family protein [Bacteroidales bacterium]|nr:nucleotidyltransferase family protein [Bacteroidales bacterium]MBO7487920.1 nucleotidyltransferase family protein [Bacteroidales bacterium]